MTRPAVRHQRGPGTGPSVLITARIKAPVADAVDEAAAKRGMSRSQFLRYALASAMDAVEAGDAITPPVSGDSTVEE